MKDWFNIIKKDHENIEIAFNKAINEPTKEKIHKLSCLLKWHSWAEEESVYQEMRKKGLVDEEDQLSKEQDEALRIDNNLMKIQDKNELVKKLKELKKSVLEHAIQHEEKNYFLQLKKKLTVSEHQSLTVNYENEYKKYLNKE